MSTTWTPDLTRSDPASGEPFDAALAAVTLELSAVSELPAWTLPDADVDARLAQALRVRAMLDELVARLLAAVGERGLPTEQGYSSLRAWLLATKQVSLGEAGRMLAQCRAMTARTEVTRRAWADGRISSEQATCIGNAVDTLDHDLPAETIAKAQLTLIEQAELLPHDSFRIVCNRLIEVVDPEGADAVLGSRLEDAERRALDVTQISVRRVGDGTSRIAGRLPDVQADMFRAALEAFASPRRMDPGVEHDVVEGGADDVSGHRGERPRERPDGGAVDARAPYPDSTTRRLTQRQRLGRAFCELLEHLPTDKLPQHGVANASLVVTIPLDTLRSQVGEAVLGTGTLIRPGQARRLACNAGLVPAVLDGASRVLDQGMSKRLFDRYQRLALATRDRGCIWRGCDRPPAWCEAHHLDPWSRLGPTDLANGCLLCGWHHRLLHQGEWSAVMAADGIPEIVPPARIDPIRKPLRHQRFRRRTGDSPGPAPGGYSSGRAPLGLRP